MMPDSKTSRDCIKIQESKNEHNRWRPSRESRKISNPQFQSFIAISSNSFYLGIPSYKCLPVLSYNPLPSNEHRVRKGDSCNKCLIILVIFAYQHASLFKKTHRVTIPYAC